MSHTKNTNVDVLDILEAELSGQIPPHAICSGYRSYDKKSCGFGKGNVSIIASARREINISMAQMFAMNIKRNQKKTVPYFSFDFDPREICHFYEGVYKGFNANKAKNVTDNISLWRNAIPSINSQSVRAFDIVDSKGWSARHLETAIRKTLNSRDVECVIVDSIQYIASEVRYENYNHNDELRCIMEELKKIAETYNIAIIATSELKRRFGSDLSSSPALDDLDGSGCLEEMADNVTYIRLVKKLALSETHHSNDLHQVCVNIAKNRMGALGNIQFTWDNSKYRFYDQGY